MKRACGLWRQRQFLYPDKGVLMNVRASASAGQAWREGAAAHLTAEYVGPRTTK